MELSVLVPCMDRHSKGNSQSSLQNAMCRYNWIRAWREISWKTEPLEPVSVIRELKQTRRRRKRERHLKMSLHVSAIIFYILKVIMLEKCVLTILELNWNQRLGHRKTKLNICHHMLTLSTQLQNRSFHVIERTRTSSKCQKMKNARAKRAKILFFIVKYANLWGFCCRRRRGCLSSLLLLPITTRRQSKEPIKCLFSVQNFGAWI